MLVPLSWLREFTPYDGDPQKLGDKLTMLGLELEEIIDPFREIAGIKVGYVAECSRHPNSDHLHCCKVDLGEGELLDIVCGAPNVARGQKVAVAPAGCRLPDGTLIKKAKLRGQPSCGMICSERELGLSDDHDGIMVLPDSAVTGNFLVDALEMDREVLDLSITPNRADCLSILGIARETAAAFHLPFNVPDLPLLPDRHEKPLAVPVSVDDPELCWLYAGRIISGAKIAKAPIRMRLRLLAVGSRPISNIVDVTNYIMFECGQPLHAFDYDKVEGGRIIVKNAVAGEKFTTLDGRERVLEATDLCICDQNRPIALAGVMGGLNSEIDNDTVNIFLESAVFQPKSIRKTSRRLGLGSDASSRFERGVDQQRSIWALDRACALMASISGGRPNPGFSCAEPKPFRPVSISYHPSMADALLGTKICAAFQEKILGSLGCGVEIEDDYSWKVSQPSWRPDLTREADLIEEVGREYGLDGIEPVLPPISRSLDDNLEPGCGYAFIRRIKHWAAGLGLNEAVNYSFVGERDLDLLGVQKEGRLHIRNPLSEDQNVLRTSLAAGLLQDLCNNLAYGGLSIKLFETANIYKADSASQTGASETGMLGILLSGPRHDPAWPPSHADFDYADIKGAAQSLLHFLHLGAGEYSSQMDHPYLSPCVALSLKNRPCGILGRVKAEIAEAYNARKPVWLGEFNLKELEKLEGEAKISYRPLPVFPSVRRDITVRAEAGVRAGDMLESILLMKLPLLEGAVLVDCFQPEGDEGRNLTFRLTFRHASRTLKDEEVDKEREKVAEFLKERGSRV